MVYAAKRSKNRCPIHPGALLRDDIVPATGRTKAEIAGLLGISRQPLYDIMQETKPVSPATAVRPAKLVVHRPAIGPRSRAHYDRRPPGRPGLGHVAVGHTLSRVRALAGGRPRRGGHRRERAAWLGRHP